MTQANKNRALLAAKMRTQGAAFRTKNLGNKGTESGSGTGTGPHIQTESGSATSGTRDPKQRGREREESDADVRVTVAELAHTKKKARVEKTGQGSVAVVAATDAPLGSMPRGKVPEGAPGSVEVAGTGGSDAAPGTVVVQSPSGSRGSGHKEVKIGKKTLSELAEMTSGIADDKEWGRLKNSSLADNYRGRLALWAQEGMVIARDHQLIHQYKDELKKMSADITQRDKLLAQAEAEKREAQRQVLLRAEVNDQLMEEKKKVQDQLDEMNAEAHTLKEKLKHAEYREQAALDRARVAEKDLELQKRKVAELDLELDGRPYKDEVIREYRDSADFEDAVTSAVAEELQRCWDVTKKLTQANPSHSYDDFFDAFFAEGEGAEEPEHELVPPRDPGTDQPEVQVEAPVDPVDVPAPDTAEVPEGENRED